MSVVAPIIKLLRKVEMILDSRDTLYFCEACEGYANVRQDNGKIIVTPCQCQFEEENN